MKFQSISQIIRHSIKLIKTIAIGVASLVLLLPGLPALPGSGVTAAPVGHKFHVSVSQVEFDRAKQSARIMIRVFADDLQTAVSQHAGRTLRIQGAQGAAIASDREMGGLIHAYLRDRLELRTKDGRAVSLNWAGLEAQSDVVWLYVEGRTPGGLAGTQLRNRLFCELYEDQVNIVNTLHQQKTIGVMFEPKDDFKSITDRQVRQ